MSAIHDPDLPLASELTEPEAARHLLQAAVAGQPIGPVTIAETVYRPGRRCLVRYGTTVGGVEAQFVAVTGGSLPEGAVRVGDGGADEVAVWRFPHDPALPGLGPLLEQGGAAALLEELGVPAEGLELSVASYRPGRRAVVEARTPTHRLFCKVVRPKRAAALHHLHRILAERVPVPRTPGWSPELGVVVLEAVPGSPVAALLAAGLATSLPHADDLVAMLDGIATTRLDGRRRPPPTERVRELGGAIAAVLPGVGGAVAEIAAACDALPPEPLITAHRDFHASQLLVHDGMVRLVDVDTVGPGARADDLAMMIAQLVCLVRPASPHAEAITAYADALLDGFVEHTDPGHLAVRIGAAVVGFATGPFRTSEPAWEAETARRMALALEWARRGV